MEPHVLSTEDRPVLDEAAFQQLLAAAYVLQEERELEQAYHELTHTTQPATGPIETLSLIAETQELLRSRPYDLSGAAEIVAERLEEITDATGVAIAVLRKDQLEYCVARGTVASLLGSHVPVNSVLFTQPAQETVQGSQEDRQLSHELSQEHGTKSSLALPLYHEGKVSGLLEVHFPDADSIQEAEIRSCQLMAGLMTEAIARTAHLEWKQALAAERATMLEVLERIRPQLERLVVDPATEVVDQPAEMREAAPEIAHPAASFGSSDSPAKPSGDAICQCGHQFGEGELFCGRCGTPRSAQTAVSGDLQSKWASLWHLQQAAEQSEGEEPESPSEAAAVKFQVPSDPVVSPALDEMIAQFLDKVEPVKESSSALVLDGDAALATTGEALQPLQRDLKKSPWTSAAKAREWLESLQPNGPARIWMTQNRANLWLGVAVVLLLVAMSGWGTHPAQYRPPQPQLTLFEEVLVGLGLAEAPTAPVYLGNPNAQVWVDVHTALYYCSGSDLYGKTPGGKLTTQRDAQMDQFEPASRKSCN